MKNILVTGGSGYIGRNLIRELLNRHADLEILSVSRSEGMISQLMMECYGLSASRRMMTSR